MDKIRISGNANLFGSIITPGSKNAALPIMVSSLLSGKYLNLTNVPDLEDIKTMIKLLENYGVNITKKKKYLNFKFY